MERLPSFLMSLALAAAAAGLAYLATCAAPHDVRQSPDQGERLGETPGGSSNTRENREAWFCGDGCEFDISREFPCACPTADDEVTP